MIMILIIIIGWFWHRVSFNDFKSQEFKLSVSNPKSKYVACLSVLSQISNCQSLGRKNKHENLTTECIHLESSVLGSKEPVESKLAEIRLIN